MQVEIEAKFLRVDHDVIRARLRELTAKQLTPMRLMKRKNYDFPGNRLQATNGWVRLRDEGEKVTLSYKRLDGRTIDGTKEVTIVVDDFAATAALLQAIGLEQQSYQETKRESWELNGVQIELDEWPWIPSFVEIEAADERAVKAVAEQLKLNWEDALHGSVEIAYQKEYDVTEAEVDGWPEIIFGPVPYWLAAKRRISA
jgi:adenylate cyclase class 2